MMELRNPMQFTAVLINGRADGQWTLPQPILDAHAAVTRVDDIAAELPPQPPEHPATVRDRLAYQIATGADVDPSPISDAKQAMADHEERVTLVCAAREIAERQFAAALRDHATETIAEHLAPAFDALVDKLRSDFTLTRHIDSSSAPAIVLSQPKNVRDALIRIDTNVTRYTLIREAYSKVRRIGDQAESPDGYGWFFEVKNLEVVWPEITGLLAVDPSNMPWPTTNPRDRLAWLFAHGAELWAPTAEEQAERWAEVFAERINEQRANRANLEGYRHMFDRG